MYVRQISRSLCVAGSLTVLAGCGSARTIGEDEGIPGYSLDSQLDSELETDASVEAAENEDAQAPVCDPIAQLAVQNGRIDFDDEGNATVCADLTNVSEEDVLSYPTLRFSWWLAHSYKPRVLVQGVLLYGIIAGDSFESCFTIEASELDDTGHILVVQADPYTYDHPNHDPSCEPDGRLTFDADLPSFR
jgi:hypothetical protein